MFLKLLKHDLISINNSLKKLFIAIIITFISIPLYLEIVNLVLKYLTESDSVDSVLVVLSIIICIGSMAFYIISLFIIYIKSVIYFKKSYFSNEKYLTKLLPVKQEYVILSKILAIIIYIILFKLLSYTSYDISFMIVRLIRDGDIISFLDNLFSPFNFLNLNSFTQILDGINKLLNSIFILTSLLLTVTLCQRSRFKNAQHGIGILILLGIFVLYISICYLIKLPISNEIVKSIVIWLIDISVIILEIFFITKEITTNIE